MRFAALPVAVRNVVLQGQSSSHQPFVNVPLRNAAKPDIQRQRCTCLGLV